MFNHTIIYEFLSFQVHENAYYSDFHHCFGMPSNSSGEVMLLLLINTSSFDFKNIYTSVSIYCFSAFTLIILEMHVVLTVGSIFLLKLFVFQSLLKHTWPRRVVNP